MSVGHDNAGVNRKGFAAHDPFLYAARDYGLEQLAQEIALAKTAVADETAGGMMGGRPAAS